MRKLGSVLVIMFACGVLAAVYFATPYLLHAHSQLANFIEIVIVAIALVIGVMMLAAGVAMRKPGVMMPRVPKMPVPPPVPMADRITQTLALVEREIEFALLPYDTASDITEVRKRVIHLGNALRIMVAMAKHNAGITEGSK